MNTNFKEAKEDTFQYIFLERLANNLFGNQTSYLPVVQVLYDGAQNLMQTDLKCPRTFGDVTGHCLIAAVRKKYFIPSVFTSSLLYKEEIIIFSSVNLRCVCH